MPILDGAQELDHPIYEGFDPEKANIWMGIGLSRQMLPPAETDLEPDDARRGLE